MKILWLTNLPSPYRVDFFNQLGKRCDLTVLFERRDTDDRDKSWVKGGFDCFRGVFLKPNRLLRGATPCPEWEVVKWLASRRYDLIMITNYNTPTAMLAIAYMKFKKIPFAIEADGGLIRDESKLKFLLKKRLISSADYWFSSGRETDRYFRHYGASEKIFRYPFSSLHDSDILLEPVSRIQKAELKRKLNLPPRPVVIAVGQFIERKGFDLLIRAARTSCTLLLIGGGPLKQNYKKIIAEKGLSNIVLLDFFPKEKLFEYFRASELFVLPTREDIWGLVVNEAMANGLPVITTENCVAGLELIEDGKNGYIVPVGDPHALEEKMERVLRDDRLGTEMGANNLRKIRPYTIENMTEEHYKWFTRILSIEPK